MSSAALSFGLLFLLAGIGLGAAGIEPSGIAGGVLSQVRHRQTQALTTERRRRKLNVPRFEVVFGRLLTKGKGRQPR
jgi:hypothetical protein